MAMTTTTTATIATIKRGTTLVETLQNVVEGREAFGDKIKPMSEKYSCIEDFVLQRGILFSSQPLDPMEYHYVLNTTVGCKFPVSQCFYNSQKLMITLQGSCAYEYVEGYVLCDDIPLPILHGWLSLHGKVIDFTLRVKGVSLKSRKRWSNRVLGEFSGREYRGVIIPREYIMQHMVETGNAETLLDDWQHHWPLLK